MLCSQCVWAPAPYDFRPCGSHRPLHESSHQCLGQGQARTSLLYPPDDTRAATTASQHALCPVPGNVPDCLSFLSGRALSGFSSTIRPQGGLIPSGSGLAQAGGQQNSAVGPPSGHASPFMQRMTAKNFLQSCERKNKRREQFLTS